MTPYERLMAEAVPTGTFGRARPTRRQQTEPAPAWTPEQQAAHRAELEAALSPKRPRRPQLRLVDTPAA
ncbi:hypothetical protein ACIG0D_27470 [Streptomyces sp. NPDC052773]|uniref:hypothetical protein n=1 Tax=Streptomyces sp. NPDC052773 TaxID=3365693 RepID=UPI0037D70D36